MNELKIDYSLFYITEVVGSKFGIGKINKVQLSPTRIIQGYVVVKIEDNGSHTMIAEQVGDESTAYKTIINEIKKLTEN